MTEAPGDLVEGLRLPLQAVRHEPGDVASVIDDDVPAGVDQRTRVGDGCALDKADVLANVDIAEGQQPRGLADT